MRSYPKQVKRGKRFSVCTTTFSCMSAAVALGRDTLACFHVTSHPAGNVTYLAASYSCEKAAPARCPSLCSTLTPRHSRETCTIACKPPQLWHNTDIQNMDNSKNMGQREHFLFSEFQKKTLDITWFLQMTTIGASLLVCL